jgi:hypothetical protein
MHVELRTLLYCSNKYSPLRKSMIIEYNIIMLRTYQYYVRI